MKRTILSLAALLLTIGAMAQNWRVVKTDGAVVNYPAADVSYVTIVPEDSLSIPDTHEYVDLGLPSGTLWATCNVGAENPEDYGDYFAWGETTPKENYSWDTYKWCIVVGSDTLLTKYCHYGECGYNNFTDNMTGLLPEDDAAYVNWGANWCMPDSFQIEELIDSSYTKAEWVTQNGVYGCKITSKTNGSSIFLPAAGERIWTWYSGTGHDFLFLSRTYSRLWMWPGFSCGLGGSNYWKRIYCGEAQRCYGYSVRPVRVSAEDVPKTSITLSASSMTLLPDSTTRLTATVVPSSTRVVWTSSDDNVARVDQTGMVTAVAGGSCLILCVAADGSGVKAACTVTVLGNTDTHEYVDLGLPSGTLWATCNVGAENPEDYGDYFAWGETTPKENYSGDTYKWCIMVGSDTLFTKYCHYGEFGYNNFTDNLTELVPEDDAAYVNWGSNWRMPSLDQQTELCRKCTWTWTTRNGKNGYEVVGPNGNSLFLPAAGFRYGTSLYSTGSYGYYWSRTLLTSRPYGAYYLYFSSDYVDWSYYDRCYGHGVRPVRAPQN